MTKTPYIPAATLIVGRDRDEGAPEYLMVRRTRDMAFAGGAWVFPGGRIDEADRQYGDDSAAVAAVRETLEEVGLPIGLSPLPDAAISTALQAALNRGKPFAALLDEYGLALDLEGIVPFARWAPKMKLKRRFDTMFLIARAPVGDWPLTLQESEIAAAEWVTAEIILARIASGEASAIFPTKRNLERLARFSSLDEAFADAAAQSLDRIVPWVEDRGGIPHVCIPEERGYPITSEPLDSAIRA